MRSSCRTLDSTVYETPLARFGIARRRQVYAYRPRISSSVRADAFWSRGAILTASPPCLRGGVAGFGRVDESSSLNSRSGVRGS